MKIKALLILSSILAALSCSPVHATPSPEGMRKPEGIGCKDIEGLAAKIMDLRQSGISYEEALPLMRGVPAYEWILGQAFEYSKVYDRDLVEAKIFLFGMAMNNTCLRYKW